MVSSLPPSLNAKYLSPCLVKGGIESLEANSNGVGDSLNIAVMIIGYRLKVWSNQATASMLEIAMP